MDDSDRDLTRSESTVVSPSQRSVDIGRSRKTNRNDLTDPIKTMYGTNGTRFT